MRAVIALLQRVRGVQQRQTQLVGLLEMHARNNDSLARN